MVKLLLCLIIPAVSIFARPHDEEIQSNTYKADTAAGCTIAIRNNGLPEPQPLLIYPKTLELILPDKYGNVTLAVNQAVELFCSDSFTSPFNNSRTLLATCQSNGNFLVNRESRPFHTLACTYQVYHTARPTGRQCFDGSTLGEVGFDIGQNRFLPIMHVCHDEVAEATSYSYYMQRPSNMGYQSGFPRPGFITGNYFFGQRDVNGLYTMVRQRETFARILGQSRVDELYSLHTDAYLARGHLMARADAIYGSHMRATFHFVNVAPQWQVFNGGNWENVESSVRSFVADSDIDVEMYTGTHGVLSLRDVNGEYKELYLDFDEEGRGLIPVPELYYKVVLHRSTNRGIVFIGVNNPHATEDEIVNHFTICNDVSDNVTWINWQRTNILRGYSYACTLEEFRRTVTNLPPNVSAEFLLY